MKNKSILTTALVMAAVGLAGCSPAATNTTVNVNATNRGANMSGNSTMNSNMPMNANSTNSMNSNSMSNANGVSMKDGDDFMTKAAQGGMAEVEMGKLAASKAQSPEVKAFAQRMVADHTKANTELKALAAKMNVTLPTDVDSAHKSMMADMSKLSGAGFDKEYVSMMVEDHEKDVAKFQKAADGNPNAEVKAFAAKTLPTLKSHLEQIKTINGKMK